MGLVSYASSASSSTHESRSPTPPQHSPVVPKGVVNGAQPVPMEETKEIDHARGGEERPNKNGVPPPPGRADDIPHQQPPTEHPSSPTTPKAPPAALPVHSHTPKAISSHGHEEAAEDGEISEEGEIVDDEPEGRGGAGQGIEGDEMEVDDFGRTVRRDTWRSPARVSVEPIKQAKQSDEQETQPQPMDVDPPLPPSPAKEKEPSPSEPATPEGMTSPPILAPSLPLPPAPSPSPRKFSTPLPPAPVPVPQPTIAPRSPQKEALVPPPKLSLALPKAPPSLPQKPVTSPPPQKGMGVARTQGAAGVELYRTLQSVRKDSEGGGGVMRRDKSREEGMDKEREKERERDRSVDGPAVLHSATKSAPSVSAKSGRRARDSGEDSDESHYKDRRGRDRSPFEREKRRRSPSVSVERLSGSRRHGDKDRERDRDRERDGSHRDRDRDRERDRDVSYASSSSRYPPEDYPDHRTRKPQPIDRTNGRAQGAPTEYPSIKDRPKDRERDRSRDRNRDRTRDRDWDRDWDRDRERERGWEDGDHYRPRRERTPPLPYGTSDRSYRPRSRSRDGGRYRDYDDDRRGSRRRGGEEHHERRKREGALSYGEPDVAEPPRRTADSHRPAAVDPEKSGREPINKAAPQVKGPSVNGNGQRPVLPQAPRHPVAAPGPPPTQQKVSAGNLANHPTPKGPRGSVDEKAVNGHAKKRQRTASPPPPPPPDDTDSPRPPGDSPPPPPPSPPPPDTTPPPLPEDTDMETGLLESQGTAKSTPGKQKSSRPPTPRDQGKQGESRKSSKTTGHGVSSKPPTAPRTVRRGLDKLLEKKIYGRTFTGVGKMDDYLRPKNLAEAKDATLGKGTFGVVSKATRAIDGTVVALKQLQNPEQDPKARAIQGVLGTTLREIKILKLLSHENIVPLLDIVVDREHNSEQVSTYLVFPYMDHDLCGLLKNPNLQMHIRLLKLYSLQLLEGIAYMHHNNIIHRDLKSANILIDNSGNLQIADFGLARAICANQQLPIDGSNDAKYTNMVVTRWYRAPELFMGETIYGPEIDIWSVGCILGEMLTKKVLFMGHSDPHQLTLLFEYCGNPEHDYSRYHSYLSEKSVVNDNLTRDNRDKVPVKHLVKSGNERKVRKDLRWTNVSQSMADLMDKTLTINPAKRPTAIQLLNHQFFFSEPVAMLKEDVIKLLPSKERRDVAEEKEAEFGAREAVRQRQEVAAIAHVVAVEYHQQQQVAVAQQVQMAGMMHAQAVHHHVQAQVNGFTGPPQQMPPQQMAQNPYANANPGGMVQQRGMGMQQGGPPMGHPLGLPPNPHTQAYPGRPGPLVHQPPQHQQNQFGRPHMQQQQQQHQSPYGTPGGVPLQHQQQQLPRQGGILHPGVQFAGRGPGVARPPPMNGVGQGGGGGGFRAGPTAGLPQPPARGSRY